MLSPVEIPNIPGTYAFELQLKYAKTIRIGKLGTFFFPEGNYIYCGSSMGPGGLASRLNRHTHQKNQNRFWHIDFLRAESSPVYAVLFFDETGSGEQRILDECQISNLVGSLEDSITPVRGFGSSDCQNDCKAHLFTFPFSENKPILASIQFTESLDQIISLHSGQGIQIMGIDLCPPTGTTSSAGAMAI